MDKAVVRNAADHKQVKKAKRTQKEARKQEIADLRYIMETPQGQRFLMRMLSKCRVNQSVWHPSAAIHKNAGIQEVGQNLYKDMLTADVDLAVSLVAKEIKEQLQGERDE